MHGPIANTNRALLLGLVKPYLAAIGSTLLGVLGSIGIIEMLYFKSLISKGEGELTIYWMEFNANGISSWAIFSVMVLGGIFLCKITYPKARESWDHAISVVKSEISS